MSFHKIVKTLQSKRTDSNGRISEEFDPKTYDEYADWANKQPDTTTHSDPMKMNRVELREYARDMYGLELHSRTTAGNCIKAIYEKINGVEPKLKYTKKSSKPATAE